MKIMIDLNSFIIMHLPFEKLFILSTNRVSVKKKYKRHLLSVHPPPNPNLFQTIYASVLNVKESDVQKRGYRYISFFINLFSNSLFIEITAWGWGGG